MNCKRPLILIISWLGLVCGPQALGAIPPRASKDPAPVALAGELLNLDWHVYVAAKPIYCLLVEKDRQRLRVLRHDGRLRVVAEYAVATGEHPGTKEVEGDAKTPEGIYLITKGYLDRKLSIFGLRAYHLNYPNWFDREAGRNGNGIFLHGTNRPLRPTSSNGCVTLRNEDMDKVADYLRVGTPIFIVPTLKLPADGEGQAGYPDLTGEGFAGARALLLPAEQAAVDFASLYLIRINGQNLVAGEYWPSPANSAPRLAVAYLQQAPDQQWAVVDRGPAGDDREPGRLEMVAGIPPQVRRAALGEAEGEEVPEETPLLWQPASETIALEWLREANVLATAPGPASLLAVRGPGGAKAEQVYLLFGLATCLSIGSALVMIRRRGTGDGDEGPPVGAEEEESIARLQGEVGEAMVLLRTMQARIDREASAMESQESLQERVKGLEAAFSEKQAAIDRLSNEQAALTAQGVAERSGQAEELGRLRGELVTMQEAMAAARVEMAEAAHRAAQVNEQLAAVKRMATEREETTMNGDELKGVVTATCDQLLEKIQAKLEGLPRLTAPPGAGEGESNPYQEVLAEFKACAIEMQAAQQEMARLREGAEGNDLNAALEGLRNDLTAAQHEREALATRLTRVDALEATVAERERKIKSLELVGAQAHSRAMLEKEKLDAALKAAREELRQERVAKNELTLRLDRIRELEGAMAEWDREGKPPLAVSEEVQVRMAEERSEHEAALKAMQAELQQERAQKATLTARLATLDKVQQTLQERDQQLAALRAAPEEAKAEAAREKGELETTILGLGEVVKKEQAAKTALQARLAALDTVQQTLTEREQELAALRATAEEAKGLAEKEKGEMETKLAGLGEALKKEQAVRATFQARLAELNKVQQQSVTEREQELATLRAAAEEAKGLAEKEKGELETKLTGLSEELKQEQAAKTALQTRLAEFAKVQQSLTERDQQLAALRGASEEAKAEAAKEKVELETTLTGLSEELKQEQAAKTALQARLAEFDKLQQTLTERDQQLATLRAASEEAKGLAEKEKGALETKLAGLGEALNKEQAAKATLQARLATLDQVQQTATEREQELAALRAAAEEAKGLAEKEKGELETKLTGLGEELKQEQAAKTALQARLAEFAKVQQGLAERDQQLASLREEKERLVVNAATETKRLQANLAEIVLARQVEVTNVTKELHEAKERATVAQEALAALQQEVAIVNDTLRQRTEEDEAAEQHSQEQGQLVTALRQEIEAFKVKVAALEQRGMDDGVVLIKGSHYLPGDVLRKWIGKESGK